MRKIGVFLLITFVVVSMIVSVHAADSDHIQPLYNNISSIVVGLRIDANTDTAYCTGAVNAYYQVPVEVLAQLQVYKNGQWKTLMTWSSSGIGNSSTGGQWPVEPGYNYRTRVTGYICNDLGIPVESETETKEVFYPAS